MPHDTRMKLILLLDECRIQQNAYLHDQRTAASALPVYAEKIERLVTGESYEDFIMGGSHPLLERYEDALEVVRKQALAIEELEAINARQRETIEMLKQAPNLFHEVMTISPRYVKRFGGTPTDEGVLLAFHREHDEFMQAVASLLIAKGDLTPVSKRLHTPHQLKANVVHEAADVLVTIGGILAYLGIEWAEFEQACRATIDKLNARTEDSYAWDGTTVQHKSKIGTVQS